MPCTTGASPMMSTTRRRGLSEAIGSWKIICTASAPAPALAPSRAPSGAAPRNARGRRSAEDAGDDAAERRLAAARLADEPDDLALADREATSSTRAPPSCRPAPNRFAAARREVERLDEALLEAGRARRSWRHAARACAAGWDASSAPCARRRGLMARHRVADRVARAQRGGTRSPAAGRERGRHAGDLRQRLAAPVPARHRADQPARVGMQRRVEHRVDRPLLDDAAGIHHGDAVGEAGDHREVVGDPDQRGAGLGGEVLHLGEDLRLDGDVERGGRLVGDQQRRAGAAARWRSRRAGACRRRTDADRRRAARRATGCRPHERLAGARARAPLRDALVRGDRLDHLGVDAQHRVERHHRVLEDHRERFGRAAAQSRLRRPTSSSPASGSSLRRCGRADRSGRGSTSR